MIGGLLHHVRGWAKGPRLKRALYDLGALDALHRRRNRRHLTTLMFHRVLAEGDDRFAYCDPEYTMRADQFAACLAFVADHYNVIGQDALAGGALPDHPLLITFDDGWADHEQVALPLLANRGWPAVFFIAGQAIDNPSLANFWEIELMHGARRGTLTRPHLEGLWHAVAAPPAPRFDHLDDVRRLIDHLYRGDLARVAALRAALGSFDPGPTARHLIRTSEVQNLVRQGHAVGGHGDAHQPLARSPEAAADLRRAHAGLTRVCERAPQAMSFPHGSHNASVRAAAQAAGYRWLFTSDPVLTPLPADGQVPTVIGRIGFDPASVVDADGAFAPGLLALKLFRAQARDLTAAD